MSFTFIHTADWQIGKSFGRFAPDVAAQLRAARLDAIDRIAEAGNGAGARHVLVAGDVIDSELIDDAGLRQPLARMAAYPLTAWHLLPGNHDPARAGGVWQRMSALGLPANVDMHLTPEVSEIAAGVALLPSPLAAKATHTDPTIWMDHAATPEGAIRVGMAHGSVQGFGSLGEAAVPLEPRRRASARLDYLALGDWHGMKEVATGVWYSGTPEPDGFTDNAPGHALVVNIEGHGAPPEVTPVCTGQHRWLDRRVVLSRLADLDSIEADIKALGAARRHLVLALTLEGAVSSRDAAELDRRLEGIAAMVLAVPTDRRALRTTIEESDVASLGDPVLARVAVRLRAGAEGETAEAKAAARAMRLLLSFEGAAA